MTLRLVRATAADRARVARIRPPARMGPFVHYNWFWLDRSLADPAIVFCLVRGGPRGGISGCIAYGPHEAVDLEPRSRVAGVGEIYHIVIDRHSCRRGLAAAAIGAAVERMRAADPGISRVRVSHHVDNVAAERLYARLGFVDFGEKIDGETGIRDRLLEMPLAAGTPGDG